MKKIFIISLLLSIIINIKTLPQTENGWSIPISICNWQEKSTHSANSNMSISKEGKIFIVWEKHDNFDNDDAAQIYLTIFNGVEWQQPIATTKPGKWDWTPDIAVDTLGNPHIVWGEYLSSEIYYIYYNGQKWSEPKNISEDSGESYYPRIAIDHANKLHIVWHDNTRGGDPSVYYRYYDGSQWSEKLIVSDTLEYSIFPRIAVDLQDNIHITWCSRTTPDDNRDVFYRCCLKGEWLPIKRLTYDTLYSIDPVIALLKTDLPIILWEQFENYPNPVKIYWSAFNGEDWIQPEAIENEPRAACRSVTVSPENYIHVVFLCDTVKYTFYNGNVWSTPINLTNSIEYEDSEPPIINSDYEGNIHVVWISYNYIWPFTTKAIFYTHHSHISSIKEIEEIALPSNFSLKQNYPNPFNPNTIIEYSIPNASFVNLAVFDALGRKIKVLVNSEQKSGTYSVLFEGSTLSSGCYFYQLKVDGYITTKKMLLLH
ncbi:T9SS type A sorting domain-containing protein [bacterium BMS3Abin03]|jgi:hypothetical protein|nr:T9SS type A sorting domain-containing protein [bacterium BMS3Abin03]MCG6958818.1 T9SS type A sorting domain-containing protein [bacterium BMS3Abin03]